MNAKKIDLIVVGAGAAGLSAATTAAINGHRVLLLESTNRVGGTTAISGGMIWIPGNHKMREAGMPDQKAAIQRYIDATVPGATNDVRMRAFLESGDAAIQFLERNASLALQPVRRYPDYYPDQPGATEGGRVLEPVPFDGRTLGNDFALLRDPLPEFMLFGGMMISREDIPKLRRMTKSFAAAWYVGKLLMRYAWQRLSARRGTALVLGNALAARLFEAAKKSGVEFALQSRLSGLVMDGDRVTGVRVTSSGPNAQGRAESSEQVIEARAVILATGGISHDRQLRALYVPKQAGERSATFNARAPKGGARIAHESGVALSAPTQGVDDALAFWVPVSTWRRDDGEIAYFPHTVTDRAKPGLIAINAHGKRFVNEARSYHEFVRAQLRLEHAAIPAWLICDSRFLWKYGLGRVRPFSLSTRRDVASGYLKKANTLAQLAGLLGVSVDAFSATVKHYNVDAAQGKDTQFERGADAYQRHLGDADHLPNPCNAPIEKGPFYAVQVFPADLGMAAGIVTDEAGRALRADGTPIDGLYACGNDMQSIMNGAYPGPGITLGPALVFGVIAAHHALGDVLPVKP